MKHRYFTPHQNTHGHREWIETDQLTSAMAPQINTSLTMGGLVSSDFHYWDGESFHTINPNQLMFHGEDRYDTTMEEVVRSEADWDEAPIGCLRFSHVTASEIEIIHIFFLRMDPPMEQIECPKQ
jgi:hypothetical protein